MAPEFLGRHVSDVGGRQDGRRDARPEFRGRFGPLGRVRPPCARGTSWYKVGIKLVLPSYYPEGIALGPGPAPARSATSRWRDRPEAVFANPWQRGHHSLGCSPGAASRWIRGRFEHDSRTIRERAEQRGLGRSARRRIADRDEENAPSTVCRRLSRRIRSRATSGELRVKPASGGQPKRQLRLHVGRRVPPVGRLGSQIIALSS